MSGGDAHGSLAAELLLDIRDLFAREVSAGRGAGKLSSTRMVGELVKLEHRPWPEMPKTGKPLTTHKLAALLSRFGVKPKHEEAGNVYRLADLADAFGRYLPSVAPDEASSLQEGSHINGLADSRSFSRAGGHEGSRSGGNPATARVPEGMKVRCPPGDTGVPESAGVGPGTTCRCCGAAMGWPVPAGLVLGGGTAAHHACHERAEVERVIRVVRDAASPETLADEAEVTMRGEPLP